MTICITWFYIASKGINGATVDHYLIRCGDDRYLGADALYDWGGCGSGNDRPVGQTGTRTGTDAGIREIAVVVIGGHALAINDDIS